MDPDRKTDQQCLKHGPDRPIIPKQCQKYPTEKIPKVYDTKFSCTFLYGTD